MALFLRMIELGHLYPCNEILVHKIVLEMPSGGHLAHEISEEFYNFFKELDLDV